MNFIKKLCLLAALVLLFPCAMAADSPKAGSKTPDLIMIHAERLSAARQRLAKNDAALKPALERLLAEADAAVSTTTLYTVTNKKAMPPSGDKHDYMSFGPYFWPNPKTKDGLPYVRRDGRVYPGSLTTDKKQMGEMSSAVSSLAMAYYFTGEEKYAARATTLLRAWFIDPATRMNPNLNFGQAIPGITPGRGTGLIDTVRLVSVPDSVLILQDSKSFSTEDAKAIREWFAKFQDWMQTSKNGKQEKAAKNNHGTAYDVQTVTYALFIGRTELAKKILGTVGERRVAVQVELDGKQPLELVRTKSFHYSLGNLGLLLSLASLGQREGVDVAHYASPDGRKIRLALDYMVQFTDPAKEWPNEEILGYKPAELAPAMLRAGIIYDDKKLIESAKKLAGEEGRADRLRLTLNQ